MLASDTVIASVQITTGKTSQMRLVDDRKETKMDMVEEHDCSTGGVVFIEVDGTVSCFACEVEKLLAREPGETFPERPRCRDIDDEKYSSDYCRAVDCNNKRHPERYLCEEHMV